MYGGAKKLFYERALSREAVRARVILFRSCLITRWRSAGDCNSGSEDFLLFFFFKGRGSVVGALI